MRHQRKGHKLGRTTSHRKATLAALSNALIENKRITTTVPKAKALRPFVEPLITRAKEDTTHNRRQVFRRLQSKEAVKELFGDVAEQVGNRPGGYTRIVKLGRRAGDGAELAMIELVDYNDVPPSGGTKRKRTRRGSGKGRRRSKKQQTEQAKEVTTETESTEAATEVAGQRDAPQGGVKATTVEEPVTEEEATPVPERTDPTGEAEEVAEARTEEDEDDVEASSEEQTGEDEEKET